MNRALLVGINYPGTSHPLRGCVNDVLNMEHVLSSMYGFTEIHKLIDHQATTDNIKNKLTELVKKSEPGDKLFFHFSGHGSQIIDLDGDEVDGKDEILCPIDLNWRDKIIKDDDLNFILGQVKQDVEVTTLLDCCHSGDGLDYPNVYQPRMINDRSIKFKGESRYLAPPEELMPSPKARTIHHKMLNTNRDHTPGILISGCRSYQTSADAYIGGMFCGACTYFLVKTLQSHNWNISYKNLVHTLNLHMVQAKFTQRPELSGSQQTFSKKFLNGRVTANRGITFEAPTIKKHNIFIRVFNIIKQHIKMMMRK